MIGVLQPYARPTPLLQSEKWGGVEAERVGPEKLERSEDKLKNFEL
jgi:hypothetical protein